MFKLKDIIRENILSLQPYSSARDEFKGNAGVFLDANENPFGELNRYPDPYQRALKLKLSELKKIPSDQIFIGNGSDEIIDLTFRIFCNPNKDKALTFTPTYGMYDVSAAINAIELIKVPLTAEFQIDLNLVEYFLSDSTLKVIFICSPNNPTANIFEKEKIEYLLKKFNGIIFIDEAYIDFSDSESWIKMLTKYPNLMVSQTFSKAWGLAAARVGITYANEEIIKLFNNVKLPYNVSDLNQKAALNALSNADFFKKNLQIIKTEKQKLIEALKTLTQVVKIYPSDANFLLVEVTDANKIYSELVSRKIITRNRNALVKNCLRITIGTPEENAILLQTIKNLSL
ncbi:MAG: histidinol-phosphate transaminase [Bacteroidetes bacterium]|nr:histidinol-phosphate transaminase [Bacteroidota bacterium]